MASRTQGASRRTGKEQDMNSKLDAWFALACFIYAANIVGWMFYVLFSGA